MAHFTELGSAPYKGITKENCERNPKFAFCEYLAIHQACFKPATTPGPYGGHPGSFFYYRKKAVKECQERLNKSDTESLCVGVSKGDGDDTIEYCLRLLTGVKAQCDEKSAYILLDRIIRSKKYTPTQRAIAANLSCTYYKRQQLEEGRFDRAVLKYADFSCKLGWFSWDVFHLIQTYELQRQDLEIEMPELIHLWREYSKFREETGVQKMNKMLCAKCGNFPGEGNKMKRCGGKCNGEKKPVYCSKECQKADWLKHKKWCTEENDIDWTTDLDSDDSGV